MIKKIYLLHNNKSIVDKIESNGKLFKKSLEIIGRGGENQKTLQEISMNNPDIVLSHALSKESIDTLINLLPHVTIVMILKDENRGNELAMEYENVNFINIDKFTPHDVLQILSEFEVSRPEDDEKILEELEQQIGPSKEDEEDARIVSEIRKEEKDKIGEKVEEVAKEVGENEKPEDEKEEKKETKKISKEEQEFSLASLKTKTITFASRKGGVGRSTLAKEMATLFANVKMPRKANEEVNKLKVCLLDLDFERGNIRTLLGIENPRPNIYTWIEDILDKIERKHPLYKIKYNKIEIITRFTHKMEKSGLYVIPTDQGTISARIFKMLYERNHDLSIKEIVEKVIESLQGKFDVVIIDTGSSYDEITECAYELSDSIHIVTDGTIADVENVKTLTDEMGKNPNIDFGRVSYIQNKYEKQSVGADAKEMLDYIKIQKFNETTENFDEESIPFLTRIPYIPEVITANNNFESLINYKNQEFRKKMLLIGEYDLPIFKVKYKKASQQKVKEKIAEERKVEKQIETIERKIDKVLNDPSEKKYIQQYFKLVENENDEIKRLSNGYPIYVKKPKIVIKNAFKLYKKILKLEKQREKVSQKTK